MPIIPYGSANLAGQGIPNVIVQVIPPTPQLNGVATDIIGFVGTASYGPVNSPVTVDYQSSVSTFGAMQTSKYDMGSQLYTANQQGAKNFICVRVTDGTDTSSSVGLIDALEPSHIGAFLTSIYTGSLANTLHAVISIGTSYTPSAPTYKLTIYLAGGIPEVFDNIGGSGITFWQNLISAVNGGQSTFRGPSKLVIASLNTGISAVTITAAGSYATIPTLTATVGTGATLQAIMKAITASVAGGGSGYAVNDTIPLAGGTFTAAAVLTVTSVSSGAITGVSISTAGAYTALPSNPISQSSTSGSGTGATFDIIAWGLEGANVTANGTGYTSASVLNISGSGGGAGTLLVGAVAAPAQNVYVLSGGTDGNDGITDADLVGDDSVTPRTGMYALRGTLASMIVLSGSDDPTYYTNQVSYSQSAGLPYMISTIAPGYQDDIGGATDIVQTAGVDTPFFRLTTGDWIQINDPINNQTRYVSPQGFIAGTLASLTPNQSALNKPIQGIVATQKTSEARIYSDTELYQLKTGRLDVITKPIPLSQSLYGSRLGINTSSNALTNQDNYPRMIYFLGQTILKGMGVYVSQPQSSDVQLAAKNTISTFLMQLWQQNLIGDVSNPQSVPFAVILDSTNNPLNRVALGFMQADVTVVLLSIIQQIIVNLDANQNSTIQILPPVQLAA